MGYTHGNFHFDDREDKIELRREGRLIVTIQGWNTLQRRLNRAWRLGRISGRERQAIKQGLTIAAQNYMTEQIQRLDALIAQGINSEEMERRQNIIAALDAPSEEEREHTWKIIASWGKRES